jgi:hypothetical protein
MLTDPFPGPRVGRYSPEREAEIAAQVGMTLDELRLYFEEADEEDRKSAEEDKDDPPMTEREWQKFFQPL